MAVHQRVRMLMFLPKIHRWESSLKEQHFKGEDCRFGWVAHSRLAPCRLPLGHITTRIPWTSLCRCPDQPAKTDLQPSSRVPAAPLPGSRSVHLHQRAWTTRPARRVLFRGPPRKQRARDRRPAYVHLPLSTFVYLQSIEPALPLPALRRQRPGPQNNFARQRWQPWTGQSAKHFFMLSYISKSSVQTSMHSPGVA